MDTTTAVENPFLDRFTELSRAAAARGPSFYDPELYAARRELAPLYSWAIPDGAAVEALCALGPLVEVGAGSGYWASLVDAAGGDVVAYDIHPPSEGENSFGHRHEWFPVLPGGPERAGEHSDRALLLCWPPYASSFALECLEAYRGTTVAYVGEGRGGCTADDAFHDRLEECWNLTGTVRIPTWPATHDRLEIWTRR